MSDYVLTSRAVRRLRAFLASKHGNGGAGGAPTPISPDAFASPFAVRWSATADSGSGAWVIWLPTISQLVARDGSYITPTGVTAEQDLATGWYTIDDAQASSTSVYLNLTVPQSGSASAEISVTAGQAQTGEAVTAILVAEMSTDSTTGAKRVKQFVDSAVILGAGDGVTPDGVSTEFIPAPAQGAQPVGDEGRLQIKQWRQGGNVDTNTVADYIQGTVGGGSAFQVLVRCPQVGGAPLLGYVPIGELYQDTSGGGGAVDMTVEFVADVDWSTNYHVLRKRLRILNLRTGAITDKPGTTYANGWEIAASSTPISSIIGS